MAESIGLYPLPEQFPVAAVGVLMAGARGESRDFLQMGQAAWELLGFGIYLTRGRVVAGEAGLPAPLVELLVRLMARLLERLLAG
jgi:hypothetical protein